MTDKYLPLPTVAKMYNIGTSTIHRAAVSGRVRSQKRGRRRYIHAGDAKARWVSADKKRHTHPKTQGERILDHNRGRVCKRCQIAIITPKLIPVMAEILDRISSEAAARTDANIAEMMTLDGVYCVDCLLFELRRELDNNHN